MPPIWQKVAAIDAEREFKKGPDSQGGFHPRQRGENPPAPGQ